MQLLPSQQRLLVAAQGGKHRRQSMQGGHVSRREVKHGGQRLDTARDLPGGLQGQGLAKQEGRGPVHGPAGGRLCGWCTHFGMSPL